MSKLAVLLVLIGILAGWTPPVRAHVLITDNRGSLGAVLHVTPDDDPVAGRPSQIFFDIQGGAFSTHAHQAKLEIVDDKGAGVSVPARLTGSSLAADYTFPHQGVYKIILTAEAAHQSGATAQQHAHVFEYSQRVARGVSGSALDEPTHAWAEISLAAGVTGMLILGIIGYNRRKLIREHSQWR